ncbi:MAG: ABC transporter substrate-binding protein [Nitrospira sp.]|nr:ABC transporter substrate-binding protein [bacterium]MBL7048269.1 ABC transporter substrate-binding protein [Nitrospira sp.]
MYTRLMITILSFLTLILLGACQQAQETSSTASKEINMDPIKIGIILPLTGSHTSFGEIEKNSFELAAEEINNAGGINGRELTLLFEDTQGKPDAARAAVEKLITQDQVVMLGGGYSSSVTYAVAEVVLRKGFPFLINTAAADKITEPISFTSSGQLLESLQARLQAAADPEKITQIKKDINDITQKVQDELTLLNDRFPIFRLNSPVSEYASGVESFLAEIVKPETAVILHENTLFGTKGAKAFENSCKKLGIKVLLSESYDAGTMDFKPLLSRVKETNPSIIYMVSYLMDASRLMNQSMELKMNPDLFIGGGGGFTMPEFRENTGKASEKVISSTLWHESLSIPGAREYYDKYLKKFNTRTEYHGAAAYAATYVIADVLKRADSHSPYDIKTALSKTDMMTVFGPVKFTAYAHKVNQNRHATYVVQWLNGRIQMIWPPTLSKVKYSYPIDWVRERS